MSVRKEKIEIIKTNVLGGEVCLHSIENGPIMEHDI